MKKIAIYQSDLHVGGIQKSLVNFLLMLPNEYEVDVFLFDKDIFYEVSFPSNIHLHFLKPLFYFNRLIPFGLLKRFLGKHYQNKKHYDIAIDFSSYRNECALGAISAHAKKRIMWVHNDISIKKREEIKYRLLFSCFKKKFQYYDAFVAVSRGIVEPFCKESGINKDKVTIIPNFINTEEIYQKSKEKIDFCVEPSKYNLVSMGRLCHQKGFDLLLAEFAEVVFHRHDMHLYIIGDGPEKSSLEEQCSNLGIEKEVTFLGNQENPFPYLIQMDGFILDSRYEGQGMVLWEAQALGLPIFIPKRLEKYNEGIQGYSDIKNALSSAHKGQLLPNPLLEYNQAIVEQLNGLLL